MTTTIHKPPSPTVPSCNAFPSLIDSPMDKPTTTTFPKLIESPTDKSTNTMKNNTNTCITNGHHRPSKNYTDPNDDDDDDDNTHTHTHTHTRRLTITPQTGTQCCPTV